MIAILKMIDWLTLRIPRQFLAEADWSKVSEHCGELAFILRGVMQWRKFPHTSIRSDTHAIVLHPSAGANENGGADQILEVLGSPARATSGNNVFGECDPKRCALDMIEYANAQVGLSLPTNLNLWSCSRIDVTLNYDLGSEIEVKQGLAYLRHSEGGRYVVRQQAETIYWSPASAMRSGKAYAKGAHLRKQVNEQKAWASEDECELARRLLRLEYSLKGQFWREQAKKRWHEYSAAELIELHNEFFGAVVGKVEIVEFEDVRGMLRKVHGANGAALTEGQVQATFAAWAMIKAYGFVEAKATIPRATFYRHQKNLFAAGLTFADFNQGNVSALKRRSINLKNYVSGWVDMAIGIPVERELLCA